MLPRRSLISNIAALVVVIVVSVALLLMSLSGKENIKDKLLLLRESVLKTTVLTKTVSTTIHIANVGLDGERTINNNIATTAPPDSSRGEYIYGRALAKDLIKLLDEANPPFSNPHDFKYIINPEDACRNVKDMFLLTYVHTSPDHFKQRMIIRETWGGSRHFKGVKIHKILFFCGATPDKNVQDSLHLESDRFGDIIQEDFHDSYKNLTYKGIMALKWISTYCGQAQFVLKTDDDIFVNIFSLTRYLKSMLRRHIATDKDFMMCHVWDAMKVMRDTKSKWFIPPSMYKDDYFTRYCSGSAFIMTPHLMGRMYKVSLSTPFFWVDDFYLTGLLPQRLNIYPMKFNSAYKFSEDVMKRFIGPNSDTAIFAHLHDLNKWRTLWKYLFEKERKKDEINAIRRMP